MHKLIYRNQELVFQALFMEAAMNHTAKLTFTTREEYLAWVKQWKEDYKNIVHLYTYEKWAYHPAKLPAKIEYYKKKAQRLSEQLGFWGAETARKRVAEINQQIRKEYPALYVSSYYATLMYLLVVRKAGKIRANTQRNLRLLAQPVA